MVEEILGGGVEQGSSGHLRPTGDLNQSSIQQSLHDPIHGDAAHGLHVRPGYRLPVGNDGERLQSRGAQSCRLGLGIQGPEPGGESRGARKKPSRGCLPHLIGATRGRHFGLKFLKGLMDIPLLDPGKGRSNGSRLRGCRALKVGGQFLGRDCFLRGKKNRLDHVMQTRHLPLRHIAAERPLGDGIRKAREPVHLFGLPADRLLLLTVRQS